MRIAIYGAGSLGTILGAYLAKAGKDVELITRNKAHVEALNRDGAKVVGTVSMNVPVKARTPDQMEGVYDVVFFLVKQTCNKAALESLEPHLGSRTIVCTLQNGLPEPVLEEELGAEHIVGCAVGWGATLLEPGVSELTSEPEKLTFDIGKSSGVLDDDVRTVKSLLECMCETHALENLMGIRWSKILINSMFSGMSAVIGGTFGDVVHHKESLRCAQNIANECIRVADAAGIHMEKMQGFSLDKLLRFQSGFKRTLLVPVYKVLVKPHRLLRASMLQDLEKGKPCEIDSINGVVCAMGKKYGVKTPFNDKVVEIIKGIEDGKYTYQYKNVEQFRPLF